MQKSENQSICNYGTVCCVTLQQQGQDMKPLLNSEMVSCLISFYRYLEEISFN